MEWLFVQEKDFTPMKTRNCNIWDLRETHAICIPTNLGWRNDGHNVMGRGLAKQASRKFRGLSKFVGQSYRWIQTKFHTGVSDVSINQLTPIISIIIKGTELIMIPSKKLIKPPFMSWKQKSNPRLISRALWHLREKISEGHFNRMFFAIPLIGAGNGELTEEWSEGIIKGILGDVTGAELIKWSGE